VNYLKETGHTVLHELGLALDSQAYSTVTPEEWKKVVKENLRADADGYFLSCTNTRMIETIDDLERDLGKPVINSNQATIWACLKRMSIQYTDKRLGRLFS
jgi:maleate cis-trans isomerase